MNDKPQQENDLPVGWVWTTIGDVATVNRRDSSMRNRPDDFPVTFLPMSAVDTCRGVIAQSEERLLGSVRKGFTPFGEGDVLLAKITPSMENGKAAIARGLVNGFGFGSTEFHVLSPHQCTTSEWLFYFIRQECFRADAKASFTGTAGQLRVPVSFVERYRIPLPPLPEQHRIVAAIETQFTRLDAGVAALRRVQVNLRRYKAAVLKAACEGRLVPTEAELARQAGRDYEPADVLLQRILDARRARWDAEHPGKRFVEPAGPRLTELPALPEGWVWTTFDQFLAELRNGYFGGRPASEPPGKPILRVSSVRPMSVSFDDLRYLPDVADHALADYELKLGDLLFTRYNGSRHLVGACGIVRQFSKQILYPDKLIRARITDEFVLPAYLEVHFNTETARSFIERAAKTTAGQYGISGRDLRATRIPLPPLAEQHRIVAEVERRLSVVAEVEATVAANLQRAARLRQAILKQAFAGRLVPQDPQDEPASGLLAQTCAARGIRT